jgi:membrane-associated phospholipid phosphatase
LLDTELARLDALLFGFEWDAAARWVADRPALDQVLGAAYFSAAPQAVAILLIGSIARPRDRNSEFFWPIGIGLILTCAVFTFTPALGKAGHVGDYIETLTTIRGGMWTVLDYSRAEGIITFPSFHATLAILFVYAVRGHRWALAVLVPLNALLIAATSTVGGHYLVDVPAGAIVAVASIAVTRALRRRPFTCQPRIHLCFARQKGIAIRSRVPFD